MAAVRTFADADVLIWAARGKDTLSQAAMHFLAADDREFVASDVLRLEVIPKAAYHKQVAEEAFYERFFAAVIAWVDVSPPLMTSAETLAKRYGFSAVDALHVSAAISAGARELITAERRTSPLFRVQELVVVSIRPTSQA